MATTVCNGSVNYGFGLEEIQSFPSSNMLHWQTNKDQDDRQQRGASGPILRNPLHIGNGSRGRGRGGGRGRGRGRGGTGRTHPYNQNNNWEFNEGSGEVGANANANVSLIGSFKSFMDKSNDNNESQFGNAFPLPFPPALFQSPPPEIPPPVPLLALNRFPPNFEDTVPPPHTIPNQQIQQGFPFPNLGSPFPTETGGGGGGNYPFFNNNNVNPPENPWSQTQSSSNTNSEASSLWGPPPNQSVSPFHRQMEMGDMMRNGSPLQQQNTPTLDLQPQQKLPSLFDCNFGHGGPDIMPTQSPKPSFNSDRDFSSGRGTGSSNQLRDKFQAMAGYSSSGPYNNYQNQKPSNSGTPVPVFSTQTNRTNNDFQRRQGPSGNNNLITPPRQIDPLLPTPKLIPYPPPPHPNQQVRNNETTSSVLLRNPHGIPQPIKYDNFVKAGSSSTSHTTPSFSRKFPSSVSSSVVPYKDEEEDDDDELFDEKCEGTSSEELAHDFFSSKMVQHFAAVLTDKPIEEQLTKLLDYVLLAPNFLSTRVSIVRNLHLLLTNTFKNCILSPYGADFIGIGSSDDSVNVFVNLTGKQGPSSNIKSVGIDPSEITKENLDELLDLIQDSKHHKFFGQIVRRTNFSFSRVNLPMISFIHSETKVRCNIRLENYLMVQEAKVIQFVRSLDPRITPLLALARYWSSVHKVLDTPEEDTKNRFISLLMLFFLARKKVIPTMAELQNLSVKREYFENLDIGFCEDYSLVPPTENPALEDKSVLALSTLALLKEFFTLFSNLKCGEMVVSLWKAEFIPKEHFNPSKEDKMLPAELRKRYKYTANGDLRNKKLDCGSRLCIQDFQDLTENLTLAIAEYDVSRFQLECEVAIKRLENIMAGADGLMELYVVTEYAT